MFYLVSQVLLILIAAALLGSALGWLIRGVKSARLENAFAEQLTDADRASHTDKEALSNAEKNNSLKDQSINNLERLLADSETSQQQFERELAEAAAGQTEQANENTRLHQKIQEYRDTDGKLRERIRRLEAMLSEAYRQSGQELLARIIELEGMLESERRKAETLPDSPDVTDIKFRVQAGRAAVNSNTSHLTVFFSSRPNRMFSSAPDKIDNLQEIEGISPAIETQLNALGIYQWGQLADLSMEEISWVDHHLSQYRGFIRDGRWVEQAQRLTKQSNAHQGTA